VFLLFYAATNGLGGRERLNWVCPQAWEIRGTPLLEVSFVFCSAFTSVAATCYCR